MLKAQVMKKRERNFRIAVTAVGGGVGQSIMKSLQGYDYQLIALDGEVLGTGLYAASNSYVIPYANDSNYIHELLRICKKEKIDLLFPGMDVELMPLSRNRELFEDNGIKVIVSSPEVIELSDDKLSLYNSLINKGINIPRTQEAIKFEPSSDSFPFIIKPRKGGARSKNVKIIKNYDEWTSIKVDLAEYIVMDYIEGDEYTCGSVNLDGICRGIIIMRRVLRDGDTYKCFVEKNQVIEQHVRKLLEVIQPYGACNVQLRLKDDVPNIFEINARCSGTTAARTLCGFNEPLMVADYVLKGIDPNFKIKESTVLRYWKELLVDNNDIALMDQHKHIINKNYLPL